MSGLLAKAIANAVRVPELRESSGRLCSAAGAELLEALPPPPESTAAFTIRDAAARLNVRRNDQGRSVIWVRSPPTPLNWVLDFAAPSGNQTAKIARGHVGGLHLA